MQYMKEEQIKDNFNTKAPSVKKEKRKGDKSQEL